MTAAPIMAAGAGIDRKTYLPLYLYTKLLSNIKIIKPVCSFDKEDGGRT